MNPLILVLIFLTPTSDYNSLDCYEACEPTNLHCVDMIAEARCKEWCSRLDTFEWIREKRPGFLRCMNGPGGTFNAIAESCSVDGKCRALHEGEGGEVEICREYDVQNCSAGPLTIDGDGQPYRPRTCTVGGDGDVDLLDYQGFLRRFGG